MNSAKIVFYILLASALSMMDGCAINSVQEEARTLAEASAKVDASISMITRMTVQADTVGFQLKYRPEIASANLTVGEVDDSCSNLAVTYAGGGCAIGIFRDGKTPKVSERDRIQNIDGIAELHGILSESYRSLAQISGAGSLAGINANMSDGFFAAKVSYEAQRRGADKRLNAAKDALKKMQNANPEDPEIPDLQKKVQEAQKELDETDDLAADAYAKIDAVDSIIGEWFEWYLADLRLEAVASAGTGLRYPELDLPRSRKPKPACKGEDASSTLHRSTRYLSRRLEVASRNISGKWVEVYTKDVAKLAEIAHKIPLWIESKETLEAKWDLAYEKFAASREVMINLDVVNNTGRWTNYAEKNNQKIENGGSGPLIVEVLRSYDAATAALVCIASDTDQRNVKNPDISKLDLLAEKLVNALIRAQKAIDNRLSMGI